MEELKGMVEGRITRFIWWLGRVDQSKREMEESRGKGRGRELKGRTVELQLYCTIESKTLKNSKEI